MSLSQTERLAPTSQQTFALKGAAIQWAAIGCCTLENGSTLVETAREIIQLVLISAATFSVKFAGVSCRFLYFNTTMCENVENLYVG